MKARLLIVAVALAMAGVVFGIRATFAQTPPRGTEFECRQTWEHLMTCRDRKTGRVVTECRKNNLTNRWECVSK